MPPAPHLGLACDGYALTEWGDPEFTFLSGLSGPLQNPPIWSCAPRQAAARRGGVWTAAQEPARESAPGCCRWSRTPLSASPAPWVGGPKEDWHLCLDSGWSRRLAPWGSLAAHVPSLRCFPKPVLRRELHFWRWRQTGAGSAPGALHPHSPAGLDCPGFPSRPSYVSRLSSCFRGSHWNPLFPRQAVPPAPPCDSPAA